MVGVPHGGGTRCGDPPDLPGLQASSLAKLMGISAPAPEAPGPEAPGPDALGPGGSG